MELTIEQALQQGVAAHKEGKLQDAERLYRAILQSQPLHPDANHNLGVLAVSVNKADAALPLFRTALESNPKIEQFWLSYIDALITEKQFDGAKQILEQAKNQGLAVEKLNALKTRLIPTAKVNESKLALKNNDDIFLYGAKDSGKSFLLQSTCNYYASDNKSSVYIPISEAIKHETGFIDSLEGLDLICLDDIDLIASNKDWEVGIFNLINDCLSSNCRLIFSSCKNPSSINFELADLRSRIKRIDHIELYPISDANLPEAIKFVSQLRSINLGDKEINYLVTYTKRNMSDLIEIISKLDQLSMELKRKITVPLIKEII